MKVTIRTVAERAGVSIPTVSRVLNAPSLVREETRERVLAVIRELDFYPNESARRLRLSEIQAIGIVFPQIRDFFFSEIYKGMSDAATAAGVQIVLHDAQMDRMRMANAFPYLKRQGCEGVIFVSEYVTSDLETVMSRTGLPVVLALTESESGQLPAYCVDEMQAAFDAVAHLICRGHRHIGMIAGPLDNKVAGQARMQGYRAALSHYGLTAAASAIAFGNFRFEHGYEAMRVLLEQQADARLTAVFAASDEMAIGAMRCLHDRGISVPDEVSVIGYDDIRLASMVTPALTTVQQPFEEIGAAAVEALLCLLAGRAREEMAGTHYLTHKIIARESVKKASYDTT